MTILATVLAGFVAAAAAPAIHALARRATGWLLALLPALLCAWYLRRLFGLGKTGIASESAAWVPTLGLELSWQADGFGLLFAALISGTGALVLVYAGGYLAGHAQLGRFYCYVLAFMASMLGLVLADNVVALFVFWELTSVTSYLLIGFDHDRPAARAAALQALLVTGGGGLALLAGLLLMAQAGGSYELSTLNQQAGALVQHALYVPIVLLVLLGAGTKSAQFPFHFWLPGAMEAPTPVSAYLHSATMVKAGVYLVARLSPALSGSPWWHTTIIALGATTMLIGAGAAIAQSDLKRVLAYSTVSALGLLMLLLGVGTVDAVTAAMAFLLAHALYKGALFLVAGAIDHATGTRDVAALGGLARAMPLTAVAAALAALSMAGVAPLAGFLAKELCFEATLHAASAMLLTGCLLAASLLFVVVAVTVGFRPFYGAQPKLPHAPHEGPISLWLGPLLLAVLGLALGLLPNSLFAPCIAAAIQAVAPAATDTLKLSLWHGWNTALALSLAALGGGLLVAAVSSRFAWLAPWCLAAGRWGPARWYELTLAGLNGLASAQTRLLQSGYVRYYLLITLLTTAGLVGGSMLRWDDWTVPVDFNDVRFYEAGLVGLVLLAIAATVQARSRLTAIAALGVVGYGVALLFVLFGAPDLAMAQFLIETLTVILFVSVFYYFPRAADPTTAPARLRDGIVAVAFGGLMAVLVLVAHAEQFAPSVSDYYLRESVPQAHGRNVVNVILVDFRALDTLGEITVLAAAGVGVFTLLGLRTGKERCR